jgi:hypothetical protein
LKTASGVTLGWQRRRGFLCVLVGIAALIAAGSAQAAIPGTYTVTSQHGVTFGLISGSSHDLISSATDEALIPLSTTSTGPARLPFKLRAYGRSFSAAELSSNGTLGFGNSGTDGYVNGPLPSPSFTAPTIFPFWDDLVFDPSDTSHAFSEGIFTRTHGTKPHRTFTISWQGTSYAFASYVVLAQVVFHEGSGTIQFKYGAPDNQASQSPSETIGIQLGGPTHFRQIAYNPPPPGAVVAGTQFTFTHR